MAGLEETGGGLLLPLTLLTLTSGAMTSPGTSKVIALATFEALELLRIQTAPQGSRIRVKLSSSARREDLLSVQILDTSCNLL
ncbi:MAG: hypothetical protein QOJ51_1963 [Acidobacteriaceae bacterium]|nr:hypothetical protein [Acidobacteriaceae bacterium]